MRICLRRGYHFVYDELVNFPPEGVEYVIPKFVSPSENKFISTVKRKLWRTYVHIFNKPNIVNLNCKDMDLIHSCAGFLIKNKFPWVVDLEHVSSFVSFEAGRIEGVKREVEKFLSLNYCKKIIPWSEAGKNSIINGLDTSGFEEKIKTVYPAMHVEKTKKIKKGRGEFEIIFVGTNFFIKGCKEVLQAYGILRKKYDINLTIVSKAPKEFIKKYPNVNFFEFIPRKKLLEEFYTKADIFTLPSYMETFGMVFLEAMSFGLPVIATNVFAIPEILEKSGITINADKYSYFGKDGLIRWKSWEIFTEFIKKTDKPEIVKNLVLNISELIENKRFFQKLGKNGRKEVTEGKFSIKNRNLALKKIYEESVRR